MPRRIRDGLAHDPQQLLLAVLRYARGRFRLDDDARAESLRDLFDRLDERAVERLLTTLIGEACDRSARFAEPAFGSRGKLPETRVAAVAISNSPRRRRDEGRGLLVKCRCKGMTAPGC